jgi:HPt (histidine-containing phosphotransfer) domain-containing protein
MASFFDSLTFSENASAPFSENIEPTAQSTTANDYEADQTAPIHQGYGPAARSGGLDLLVPHMGYGSGYDSDFGPGDGSALDAGYASGLDADYGSDFGADDGSGFGAVYGSAASSRPHWATVAPFYHHPTRKTQSTENAGYASNTVPTGEQYRPGNALGAYYDPVEVNDGGVPFGLYDPVPEYAYNYSSHGAVESPLLPDPVLIDNSFGQMLTAHVDPVHVDTALYDCMYIPSNSADTTSSSAVDDLVKMLKKEAATLDMREEAMVKREIEMTAREQKLKLVQQRIEKLEKEHAEKEKADQQLQDRLKEMSTSTFKSNVGESGKNRFNTVTVGKSTITYPSGLTVDLKPKQDALNSKLKQLYQDSTDPTKSSAERSIAAQVIVQEEACLQNPKFSFVKAPKLGKGLREWSRKSTEGFAPRRQLPRARPEASKKLQRAERLPTLLDAINASELITNATFGPPKLPTKKTPAGNGCDGTDGGVDAGVDGDDAEEK